MSWLPQSTAAFGPAVLAALMVAAYLVLGEPFVGWVLHRRFEAAVATAAGARRWLYRRLLILEWGLVALVGAVSVVSPQVGWSELGVRWPDRAGWLTGIVVVVVLAVCVLSVRAMRNGALRNAGLETGALRSVGSLLPRTPSERRLFTATALTAGIAEEVVYRGFGIAVLVAIGPSLPWWAVVVLAGVAFGLAHAYQGTAGILTTGLLGAVLAAVYFDTGSLLIPVFLHALIDLRFLGVPADVLPESGGPPPAPSNPPRRSTARPEARAHPSARDRAQPGEHDTRPIERGERPIDPGRRT